MYSHAETTRRKKTAADYMALGEGPPFAELINGEIVMAPSPSRSHQRVIQRIYQLMQNHLGRNPCEEAYLAPFASTAWRDRKDKREIYTRHGVKELWKMEPMSSSRRCCCPASQGRSQ